MKINIANTVNFFEDKWNHYDTNLKYDIRDVNWILYIQDIKVCDINLINNISYDSSVRFLNLKDNSKIIVYILWCYPKDVYISQISRIKDGN